MLDESARKEDEDSELTILRTTAYKNLLESLTRYKAHAARSANDFAYQTKEKTDKLRCQMLEQVQLLERDQEALRKQIVVIQRESESKVQLFRNTLRSVFCNGRCEAFSRIWLRKRNFCRNNFEKKRLGCTQSWHTR